MTLRHLMKAVTALAIASGMAFAGAGAATAAESGASATAAAAAAATTAATASPTITNDTFWKDTDGNPIYSQGGGIFDFTDPATGKTLHYWYGVHFKEAETYAAKPTDPINNNTFVSVDVYSSTDLVNWKNEGQALTREQADAFSADFGGRKAGWVCRMGVAYVKSLKKYAMLIQHEMPTDDSGKKFDKKVLLATSDTPTGPFTAERRLDMKDYGLGTTNTGDQSVFQDTDGTGYLIYSYGSGRGSQWVAQIGEKDGRVDLLNPTKVYQGRGREGNAMFKYKNKYYYASSDLFGWDSSRIHYLVADNIYGPYTPTNSTVIMDGSREDFGHIIQTGFYYTVHGSKQETVIHAGDRWADFAGNGLGYNQWNPLSFSADGTPSFNSMSQWSLDAATGEWAVGKDNNYVLNGSFEADRVPLGVNGYNDKDGKNIPDLAGWTRTNPAAVYNDADKAGRVGDYNLQFNSASAYTAKIEQTVKPARFAFPDGEYTLSVQHMSTKNLKEAKLYAVSGGKTYETSLAESTGGKWVETSVPVTVSGGEAVVGISVDGNAGDLLRADDVTLVRADGSDGDNGNGGDNGNNGGTTDPDNPDPDTPSIDSSERLVNGGFEEGSLGDGAWTITGRNGVNNAAVGVKNKDAHDGGYALGSWTSGTQDYALTQTAKDLPAGWYELSGWSEGDPAQFDEITLDLLNGEDVLGSSKVALSGTDPSNPKAYVWGQSKTMVYFAGGDLTARLSVRTATKGAWASFDDFSLKQVAAPAVSALELASKPSKTEYTVGDAFDPSGLAVTAVYLDGQGKEVRLPLASDEYTVSGFDSSAVSDAVTVTVASKADPSKTVTFTVKVAAKSDGGSGDGSGDGTGDGSGDNGGSTDPSKPGSGDGAGDGSADDAAKPTPSKKPSAKGEGLPKTGASVTGVVAFAMAALAAGGVALVARRRVRD
ncbi:family 43 glycosylhydrolase [Bifidobacterium sp. CP2]|uniref:family 43 glycosylhydrolase n=1 Tax=Bifidobacterium sp. CP2 TaxID=2809025 RepID=UPI001BDD5292|nr:family 43 glycosylhydrolase [Bifidobacterium sp. CP2]MBT1180831.1 family 43 glycosylhydrolase [Bifidobacterium sp. CP2]